MNEISTTSEAYGAFDEFIREMQEGDIVILGITIDPADALLGSDPIAYRCMFNDWADGEGIDTDKLDGQFYRH
jgi:hypothetical protein